MSRISKISRIFLEKCELENLLPIESLQMICIIGEHFYAQVATAYTEPSATKLKNTNMRSITSQSDKVKFWGTSL